MKHALTIFSSFLLLLALSACNGSGYLPCQVQVNGICYDKPKASNPPITASWQIMDADTLKPIPGVWISFYWKKFPDGEQRGGTCARNVIGQTDANGRFSNTAKDGSWMFADVHMFKGGYRQIRTEFLPERTALTDRIKINQEYVGKYPEFESELKSMGYQLDTSNTTNAYFKTFEVGENPKALLSAAWEPQGEKQYWVSKRGIPDGQDLAQVGGYKCYNRALGKTDPNAEFVGYKGPDWDANSVWNREMATEALNLICDDRWDTVPSDFEWSSTPEYYNYALRLMPRENPERNTQRLDAILKDYPKVSDTHSRRFSKTERNDFCNFMRPFSNGESK